MDDEQLEEFMDKLKLQDIDPDQIIYSLSIRDVLVCMDYVYDEELASVAIDKIKELIAIGANAAEDLPWHDVITLALTQARRKENG